MAIGSDDSEMHVLGGFEARIDGLQVTLGGPRQRAVLARIIAGGDTPVPADQIIDDVWEGRIGPPAVGAVHAYVSRLRKVLGEDAIPRRRGGYVLDTEVVAIDAERFAEELATARAALTNGDDAAAAAALESALGRWRGPHPFGELAGTPFLLPGVARLQEQRTVAAELLADVHARQGRGAEDVELLEELAVADPLREALAVRLIRALYAAGRQADALTAYDRCRRALAEQLGIDPTPELRDAYAAVLAHSAPAAQQVIRAAQPVNLPPRNQTFVGREPLLGRIGRELDDRSRSPHALVLTGIAGAGKTEIALELAHRRRTEGCVAWWVAAEDPTGVAASLAALATELGIAPRAREQDTRAEMWALLDRTPGWVIVFDNVDEPGWVEPFLPRAVRGDVIVTSRNPAWRKLGRPLAVPSLGRAEAVSYITRRSGDPDEVGATRLAELLDSLPLALEQACAYIEQTAMTVADYVRLFQLHRASLLIREDAGDGPTIATTWGLAFDRLRRRSTLAASVLETMSYLAADAVTVAMLAPMADDELDLHDALAELLRLSLVDRQGDVVRVHRLVQDVVRARLPLPERSVRLAAAVGLCVAVQQDGADADAHSVPLAGHAEALGVVPDGLVEALSTTARRYQDTALYPAAEQILRQAARLLDTEERTTGHAVEASRRGAIVCQLGEVLDTAGRVDEAMVLHREAVELLDAAADPDPAVVARAYNRLGHVLNCADRSVEAVEAHEHAIVTLTKAGLDHLLPPVLIDLGFTLWHAGEPERAEQTLDEGRRLLASQALDRGRLWAHATGGLGILAQDSGELGRAVVMHNAAVEAFTRECGLEHPDTAQALDKLGYTLRLQGDADGAVRAHKQAVRLLERVFGPDDSRVAMALTNLGLAHLDAGRVDKAAETQARAVHMFRAALGTDHVNSLLATRRWAVALALGGEPVRAQGVLGTSIETALLKAGTNAAERARILDDAAIVLGTETDGPEGVSAN